MKRFWDQFSSWEEAEKEWDARAEKSSQEYSIRKLKSFPKGPQIVEGEEQYLRWKGLYWLLTGEKGASFWRKLIFHPFSCFGRYIRSLRKKNACRQDGDLFFYGVANVGEMRSLLQEEDVVLVVGFSYCQKPIECPCGRFSQQCSADLENGICKQCFIGKAYHSLPCERTIFSVIPTAHDIGVQMIDAEKQFPGKKVLFLITTCEMALKMFGDFAHALGARGIAVRLSGRVCNTMKAFALSERGVKPGMTQLRGETGSLFFSLLRRWRDKIQSGVIS